jgi:hypothetical protein
MFRAIGDFSQSRPLRMLLLEVVLGIFPLRPSVAAVPFEYVICKNRRGQLERGAGSVRSASFKSSSAARARSLGFLNMVAPLPPPVLRERGQFAGIRASTRNRALVFRSTPRRPPARCRRGGSTPPLPLGWILTFAFLSAMAPLRFRPTDRELASFSRLRRGDARVQYGSLTMASSGAQHSELYLSGRRRKPHMRRS